jgi:hypothetical protein
VANAIIVSPIISIILNPANLLQGITRRKTTENQIIFFIALTENDPDTSDKVEKIKKPKKSNECETDIETCMLLENPAHLFE